MTETEWEPVWTGEAEYLAEIIADSLRQDGYHPVVRGSSPSRHVQTPVGVQAVWTVLVPVDEADDARQLLTDRDEPGVSDEPGLHDLSVHAGPLKLILGVGLIVTAVLLIQRLLAM